MLPIPTESNPGHFALMLKSGRLLPLALTKSENPHCPCRNRSKASAIKTEDRLPHSVRVWNAGLLLPNIINKTIDSARTIFRTEDQTAAVRTEPNAVKLVVQRNNNLAPPFTLYQAKDYDVIPALHRHVSAVWTKVGTSHRGITLDGKSLLPLPFNQLMDFDPTVTRGSNQLGAVLTEGGRR